MNACISPEDYMVVYMQPIKQITFMSLNEGETQG